MLKGELIYIRHEHKRGISNKTGEPYEFSNVTLSDGLESLKLNYHLSLTPMFNELVRGEKIMIEVDLSEGFNRLELLIIDVVSSSSKKAG